MAIKPPRKGYVHKAYDSADDYEARCGVVTPKSSPYHVYKDAATFKRHQAVLDSAARLAAADQVVGKTQAAGVNPTVKGIAGRRLAALLKRSIDVADALTGILKARDSDNPQAAAFANSVLANPNFCRAFGILLDLLRDDIAAAAGGSGGNTDPGQNAEAEPSPDAAKPAGGWAVSDPTAPGADPDEVESAETVARSGGGSKLPGTDAAAIQRRSPVIDAYLGITAKTTTPIDAYLARV